MGAGVSDGTQQDEEDNLEEVAEVTFAVLCADGGSYNSR